LEGQGVEVEVAAVEWDGRGGSVEGGELVYYERGGGIDRTEHGWHGRAEGGCRRAAVGREKSGSHVGRRRQQWDPAECVIAGALSRAEEGVEPKETAFRGRRSRQASQDLGAMLIMTASKQRDGVGDSSGHGSGTERHYWIEACKLFETPLFRLEQAAGTKE
jgi:hypothetical protein